MSEHRILRYVVKDLKPQHYLRRGRNEARLGEEWTPRIEDAILFETAGEVGREIERFAYSRRRDLAPVPVYLTLSTSG